MNATVHAFNASFSAELTQLKRSPLLISLVVIQAITFIVLVNFFGMTGSFAPTAVIDNDNGYYSKIFIKNLMHAHHSFDLRFMKAEAALQAVSHGKLVAIITIPQGFSSAITAGQRIPLNVIVDNIDTDMTEDIQRALPSAVSAFAKEVHLPGIHVRVKEKDLLDHETGFVPYLSVSSLALIALIIAGILGAVTISREFESKTAALLVVSPMQPIIPFIGRIMATNVVSGCAMSIAVGIVVWGHHVRPVHPYEMAATLVLCITIFGFMGAALGALLKRTLPVASLIFGISLPLYLFSGSYEPERFDGNSIWVLAHFNPLYYAVGILEHAAFNIHVTPESTGVNFLILVIWAVLALTALAYCARRDM